MVKEYEGSDYDEWGRNGYMNGREAINTIVGWMFMVIEKKGVLETV